MILRDAVDTRKKKGMEVSTFSHTLKTNSGPRYIKGFFIEEPYFIKPDEEMFHKFCVYIKQGEQVIGFLTGLISDWVHYFDGVAFSKLDDFCEKDSMILCSEFEELQKQVRNYEFDATIYSQIDDKYGLFRYENGFILIDKLWVHPFYRKKGYAKILFKALKKQYGRFVCYIITSLPFNVDNLNDLYIKDRKIKVDTFDKLCIYDLSEEKLKKNSEILDGLFTSTHFRDFSVKKVPFKKTIVFSFFEENLIAKINEFL